MRLKRLLSGKASVEVAEEKGVRTLHLGGDAIQSAMRLSAPDRLELAYTRAMMSALLFKEAPREILMIGLGGGSIARFAHQRMLNSRMTVVEINPKVVAAARSFFGVPFDDGRLKVEVADGGAYVRAHPSSCDLLLLDAFDDGRSVKSLATQSFYDACAACLRPGGVFSVNFIEDEPRFPAYLNRIENAFKGRVLVMPSEDRVNNIVLAIKDGPVRLAIENLKRQARALKRRYELPFDLFLRDLLEHNDRTSAYLRLGLPEASSD
ncbi:MAG TPA: fused MFS/spermidine synthase [Burkholderiales bacterium]|nr:fused MFS/spermidine synthase [Burkholderiales bacterium]